MENNDVKFTDTRQDFVESWLAEMPFIKGTPDAFNQLVSDIQYRKSNNNACIKSLGNNLYKVEGPQLVYYWYEVNGEIALAMSLSKKPQNLTVNLIGKNPKFTNDPPWASTLYDAILKDNNNSIMLSSDQYLSDESYKTWQRLFGLGRAISVYDINKPETILKTFANSEEMEAFISVTDKTYSKYRYVISETDMMLWETTCLFRLRRYRELSDLL